MFPVEACYALGVVAAIVVTILLYIKVMPQKKDGTFDNSFSQFLHDYFHFKKLYLEEVLKFVFVLASVACVCLGAFLVLGYEESFRYSYYDGYVTTRESTIGIGLSLLIGGPIGLRLSYEMIMMFILAVKNIMDINNKLSKKPESTQSAPEETQAPVFKDNSQDAFAGPATNGQFAAKESKDSWVCPQCGTENSNNYGACKKCGKYREN